MTPRHADHARAPRARAAGIGALLALCAAALGALAACAGGPGLPYTFASAHSGDVRAVHVPIFANQTQHEGLEARLTEAIIKEIQRNTPWRVTNREQADTILNGTIKASDLRTLSRGRPTGLAQEVAVELSVDFDWTDAATGEPIQRRRGFSALATFMPDRRVGERRQVGEQGAADELAAAIVGELRADW